MLEALTHTGAEELLNYDKNIVTAVGSSSSSKNPSIGGRALCQPSNAAWVSELVLGLVMENSLRFSYGP